jgi:hypothetical protein
VTPDERAEKIFLRILPVYRGKPRDEYRAEVEVVEAEIREAEEIVAENVTKLLIAGSAMTELGKRVKAEAYEDAAKMVESQVVWTPDHVVMLVQKIRARKDEVSR